MAGNQATSRFKTLLTWNVVSFILLPILLLKLSIIPASYELLVYAVATAGLAVALYFGWRAADGNRRKQHEHWSGLFFLAGIIFITADTKLLGARGLTALVAFVLLGLGGYYSWRMQAPGSGLPPE